MPLVITNLTEEYIQKLVGSLKIDTEILQSIKFMDYLKFEDLPLLYNAATLFMYPSFREGFGLPIIESMACGTPVITSNTSSMPEVASGAASLVNPGEPKEIAAAIIEMETNTILTKEKISQGLVRAKEFSWENTARNVLKLYESMAQ